jgi:hypothetical protein
MPLTRRTLARSIIVLAAAGVPSPSRADDLPPPAGKVILTISGAITQHNRGSDAVFDRPMLEGLGWSSFETRSPWYNGPNQFAGVLMRTLLQKVGASGRTLVVTALNDYTTQIPLSDFARYDVLLALKRDGNYMPVSDKGPLFIVYPYDSDPELRRQTYYSRSAWQVSEMQVV